MQPVEEQSYLLFFLACIPVRLMIALAAYATQFYSHKLYLYFGIVALSIAAGFFIVHFQKLRPQGILKQPAWWDPLRLVHGTLWALAGIIMLLSSKHQDKAWIVLIVDALLGAVFFLAHHKGSWLSSSSKESM